MRMARLLGTLAFWAGVILIVVEYAFAVPSLRMPALASGIAGLFVERVAARFIKQEALPGLLRRRLRGALAFYPVALAGAGIFFGGIAFLKEDGSRAALVMALATSAGACGLLVLIGVLEWGYRCRISRRSRAS